MGSRASDLMSKVSPWFCPELHRHCQPEEGCVLLSTQLHRCLKAESAWYLPNTKFQCRVVCFSFLSMTSAAVTFKDWTSTSFTQYFKHYKRNVDAKLNVYAFFKARTVVGCPWLDTRCQWLKSLCHSPHQLDREKEKYNERLVGLLTVCRVEPLTYPHSSLLWQQLTARWL